MMSRDDAEPRTIMLPERTTQLLTAYIDGELSARQRKQVTRMLQKSAEARRLLKKMRQDSNILRKLPRRKMKIQDLSGSVMGTIAMRGLKLPIPLPSPQRTPRHRIPLWVGLAAAAAVFLVVGIASYFFFASFAKGA